MAGILDSRPSTAMYDVEELVNLAWNGSIRVPHFQRDFRWGWEDVSKLFDSVLKGYPVGSLLLWKKKAEKDELKLGNLNITASGGESLWVVDGQQRITSLANALHPDGHNDPRFAISYDLETERFVRPRVTDEPHIVPLYIIFDLQSLLKWFANNPQLSEYLDKATNLTRVLRQFEIPAYEVVEDDTRVLQDIFDRMNNYGKRLSRAEIFSALNANENPSADRSRALDDIAGRIMDSSDFGLIDDNTVLAAILARRGADIRRDIRSEFVSQPPNARDEAYDAGEEAIGLAIQFLQRDAYVPHFSILAYRYLLVVLTRFFAHHPNPDRRTRQLLRRWYWRAAEAGPENYKGGVANAARVLSSAITENDTQRSVSALLDMIERPNKSFADRRLDRFATNEAATKILLCAWWSRRPRNLLSGEEFTVSDLSTSISDSRTARNTVTYILGSKLVSSELRKLPANRLLLPGIELEPKEIPTILISPPVDLEPNQWSQTLHSHTVSDAALDALQSGDFEAFINIRQQEIVHHTNNFLNSMQEWEFEDTPPLNSLIIED